MQIYGARNGHFPFIADYAYFCSLLRISSAFFHSRCKDTAATKPFPRTSVRFLFVFLHCLFPTAKIQLQPSLHRVTTGFAGINADKSAFVPYSSINCQMVDCQTAVLSSPCIIPVSSPYHPVALWDIHGLCMTFVWGLVF